MFLSIPKFLTKANIKFSAVFCCFQRVFFVLLLLVFSLLLLQLYLRHSANSERKRETTTSWANLLTELPLIVQWAEADGAWLLVFNFPLRLLKHRRVHVCVCVCVRNFMIALYCSFCCCWSFKFIFVLLCYIIFGSFLSPSFNFSSHIAHLPFVQYSIIAYLRIPRTWRRRPCVCVCMCARTCVSDISDNNNKATCASCKNKAQSELKRKPVNTSAAQTQQQTEAAATERAQENNAAHTKRKKRATTNSSRTNWESVREAEKTGWLGW